ncbi:MAG: hypothetical protein ACK55Z_37095, partial [bacterium]
LAGWCRPFVTPGYKIFQRFFTTSAVLAVDSSDAINSSSPLSFSSARSRASTASSGLLRML